MVFALSMCTVFSKEFLNTVSQRADFLPFNVNY